MDIALSNKKVTAIFKQLIQVGLNAADPGLAVHRSFRQRGPILSVGQRKYDLKKYRQVVVVGAGKASGRMARAVEETLGDRVKNGLVVVKYGHSCQTKAIRIQEARHPLPDQRCVRAARAILELIKPLTPEDLLIVLISGGASSLLSLPATGLSLSDKQKTTDLLLRSGASIQEINSVRKHISAIKGGRLAAASHGTMISLILSDVLGDDLSVIGSGPTAPDITTFHSVKAILQRYGLWKAISESVRNHVTLGEKGRIPETPKPGSLRFAAVQNEIIGNNILIVDKVSQKARKLGFHTMVLTTTLQGEAREVGKVVGALAQEVHGSGQPIPRPACLLFGGELTVTIRGQGKGGRAQEFALSAATAIEKLPNVWIAGFGTDGTDGPTDAAGAVVDGQTIQRASKMGIDPIKTLASHDSYTFFKKVGGHIITGPTGTNVNDLYILLAL